MNRGVEMGWIIISLVVGVLWVLSYLSERIGGNMAMLVLLIGIILFIGMRYLYKNRKNRCPSCGKWLKLEKFETEKIGVEDISVLRQVETKDFDTGRVTATTEQYIPGVRTFYKDFYECKHCGSVASRTYSTDRAKV